MSDVPEAILARLWPGRSWTSAPLPGGITNRNYLVEVDGARYVLRVPGKDTALLGIDRRAEAAAARMAAAIGVGPEVVGALEPDGCLVTRFVDAEAIPMRRMRDPDVMTRVADSVRRVHTAPALPSRFDSHDMVRRYARAASDRGVRLPADYGWALGVADRIRAARSGLPARPCHNDLLNANFLDDGDRVWILDWEYAGMGDVFFDLGNFSVKHDFTESDDRAFLERYAGATDEADLGAVRLMRFMGAFFEAMWAVVQLAVSEMDFDYERYARENFDRLHAIAGDDEFGRWFGRVEAAVDGRER